MAVWVDQGAADKVLFWLMVLKSDIISIVLLHQPRALFLLRTGWVRRPFIMLVASVRVILQHLLHPKEGLLMLKKGKLRCQKKLRRWVCPVESSIVASQSGNLEILPPLRVNSDNMHIRQKDQTMWMRKQSGTGSKSNLSESRTEDARTLRQKLSTLPHKVFERPSNSMNLARKIWDGDEAISGRSSSRCLNLPSAHHSLEHEQPRLNLLLPQDLGLASVEGFLVEKDIPGSTLIQAPNCTSSVAISKEVISALVQTSPSSMVKNLIHPHEASLADMKEKEGSPLPVQPMEALEAEKAKGQVAFLGQQAMGAEFCMDNLNVLENRNLINMMTSQDSDNSEETMSNPSENFFVGDKGIGALLESEVEEASFEWPQVDK